MERRTKILLSSLAAAGVTFLADVLMTPSHAEPPAEPTPKPTLLATVEVRATPTARLSELVRATSQPLYIEYKTGSPVPIYRR